ncbi:MAG: AMP-binding protein, partial [bacterium]|nr:AMP-binding protein [bacterium]
NVTRLEKNINYAELSPETRKLQTGATVFDAVTFEIWGALLNGGRLYTAKKECIIDYHSLGSALQKHLINLLWLSSPLFNQLVQQGAQIFSGLEQLLVGGDVLAPIHINTLRKSNPHIKIINGYGPTENTTFSTSFQIEALQNNRIPIGKPIANSTAYIVDKYDRLVPVGAVGELLVGGEGVARGYLNNPSMTGEKFVNTDLSPSRLYRTGDLARWLPNGNIDFLGRIDRQVKIRGFRVEPAEIENRLLAHEGVKEAVVIVGTAPRGGEKFLRAYIVPRIWTVNTESAAFCAEFSLYLSQYMPPYMVPDYFIPLERIPLNINGKVDTKALPTPVIHAEAGHMPLLGKVEKTLAEIWSDILNIGIEDIGPETHFFRSGGHSLKVTSMIFKIRSLLGVHTELGDVSDYPTLRLFAAFIRQLQGDSDRTVAASPGTGIRAVEKKECYPMSPAQKRIYFAQFMAPRSTAYNVTQIYLVDGPLDIEKLERASAALVHAQEGLRTSFRLVNHIPMQVVHEHVDFKPEFHDLSIPGGLGNTESAKTYVSFLREFVRPFDFSIAPMLRFGIIKHDVDSFSLVLDLHHIICDGRSLEVFLEAIDLGYGGEDIKSPVITYKDYTEWYLEGRGKTGKEAEYWLKEFANPMTPLQLPYDFSRPEKVSFTGDHFNFEMHTDVFASLKAFIADHNTTLFNTLLSVFYVFLAKTSGREEVVVGSPALGRSEPVLMPVMGMFVNTLALKGAPTGDKTFDAFLAEVKNTSLKAFENQDYPLEDLVEKLDIQRDANGNTLFNVLFGILNHEGKPSSIMEFSLPGVNVTPFDYNNHYSMLDITFYAFEKENKIDFIMEYSTNLFEEHTIKLYSERYLALLRQVLEKPGARIKELKFDTPTEKQPAPTDRDSK